MSTEQEPSRRPAALVIPLAGIGLALAGVPLTWWGIGDLSTDTVGQAIGPFHVPMTLLYASASIVLAAVSLAVIVRDSRSGQSAFDGLSKVSTVLLVATGVLTAAGGRFVTRGQPGGADIGGGLLVLFGPIMIVALLIAAAASQWNYRRGTRLSIASGPYIPQ